MANKTPDELRAEARRINNETGDAFEPVKLAIEALRLENEASRRSGR
jgi:hypothetical protein